MATPDSTPATLEIQLSQGLTALIDASDYELVSRYRWYAHKEGDTAYALAYAVVDGKKTKIRMHRLLLNAPDELLVDHKNRNGLDNRRSNLRLATRAQNQHNRRGRKVSSSRFKGVYWHKPAKKWCAFIVVNWEKLYLGLFTDEEVAAREYDKAATHYFGEFCLLNFPEK